MKPQLMHADGAGDSGERRHADARVAAEMRAAIAAVLFENPRNLDMRLLWTRVWTSYFRVNRWTQRRNGEARIARSEFISVTQTPNGYRVRGGQPPRAAA